MALSFCLRDTAAFPAALHLRHPLLRASPECRAMLPRTSFQFFLCAQLCTTERLYHILPPCASSFSILCRTHRRNAKQNGRNRPTGQKHHRPRPPGDRVRQTGAAVLVSGERDGLVGFALGQQPGTLQCRAQGQVQHHHAHGGGHAVHKGDAACNFGQRLCHGVFLTKDVHIAEVA